MSFLFVLVIFVKIFIACIILLWCSKYDVQLFWFFSSEIVSEGGYVKIEEFDVFGVSSIDRVDFCWDLKFELTRLVFFIDYKDFLKVQDFNWILRVAWNATFLDDFAQIGLHKLDLKTCCFFFWYLLVCESALNVLANTKLLLIRY